jgi:hypothetical protein
VLALFGVALLLTVDREGGLPALLQPKVDQVLRLMDLQRDSKMAIDYEKAAASLAHVLPSALGLGWLTMMTVNGTLAQALAVMVRQNRRPTPKYTALVLPRVLAVAFGVAVVAGLLLPGDLSFVGATAATVLAFPFFLQGLAVVHGLAAKVALPGLVLAVFYAALVLVSALVGVLVVILGFIEQWAGFRRRLAGAGASQEKN